MASVRPVPAVGGVNRRNVTEPAGRRSQAASTKTAKLARDSSIAISGTSWCAHMTSVPAKTGRCFF
jgi:hypothetical protein